MLASPTLVTLLAADVPSNPPVQVVQLDVQAMAALLGLLVPLVVAFITKKYSSNAIKAIVNIVASACVAVIALWAQYNGHITWWAIGNTVVVSFIASLTAYHGFWKNVDLNSRTAPNQGIGRPLPPGQQ